MTAHEIIHYLLDGGLLAHSAVVAGDVIVVEDARRHYNYTILPDLFVKRVQGGQPHAVATLHKEASCYALINGDPALAEIDRHLPRLIAYDPQAHVLVVKRIEAHRTARLHPQPLGETLARIHDVSRRALIGKIESAIFTGDPPWILSLHRYAAIEHAGAATEQFIGILRANPHIGEKLDALHANWCRDVLMHGDVKFDNVLVTG
ncbi:MAG TPA: phosphotransferase, partial [Thermoanaerobaculia bacterium]|nr:phosphotransferase [Thermoanaerobaculia bacterium]